MIFPILSGIAGVLTRSTLSTGIYASRSLSDPMHALDTFIAPTAAAMPSTKRTPNSTLCLVVLSNEIVCTVGRRSIGHVNVHVYVFL